MWSRRLFAPAAAATLSGALGRHRSLCDTSTAQPGYRLPPPELVALADANVPPAPSIRPKRHDKIVYFQRAAMLTLEDVTAPALKLAGARFNPCTLVHHGAQGPDLYTTELSVQDVATAATPVHVAGLPPNARIGHASWSPDGRSLALAVRTGETGDDAAARLWLLDVSSDEAPPQARMAEPEQRLNCVLGSPFLWLPDSTTLIVKRPVGTRDGEPPEPTLPASPAVQQAAGGGAKAAVRTYPNLLTSEADAARFRHYASVQLTALQLSGSAVTRERELTAAPTLSYGLSASPDGRYLLHSALRSEHFSFSVPWSRFGQRAELLRLDGLFGDGGGDGGSGPPAVVRVLVERPVLEVMPIGHDAVRAGPRNIGWRPDRPATLYWAEALDGGDPKRKVAEGGARDRVVLLDLDNVSPPGAEGEAAPRELARTATRYQFAKFSAEGDAMVWERWYNTRRTIISFVPADGGAEKMHPMMTYDFSDGYNHPGSPLSEVGPYGRGVLRRFGDDGGGVLWEGSGASEDGARPFIDVRGFRDGERRQRLWRGAVGCYDSPSVVLSTDSARRLAPGAVAARGALLVLLTTRQTQTQPPQLLMKAVTPASAAAADGGAKDAAASGDVLATLNDPPHPQPLLQGCSKTLIKYERADGVQLSGTLHLPRGYDAARDGPLPTLLWAYPREYKSKGSASQVRGSEHTFTRVHWGSPLFHLARGYAVLDGFAAPIVGEGDAHENDGYVEQLVLNAEAAVAELKRRGVSDGARLAVGGHSYGAFMTANLLARTDLFACGIARNGAYNRSLTPFGFQAEERSFWEAQETYAAMSPFFHADKVRAPLLLIHGADDPNPGTFPMQSERLFQALKGLGKTARLCLLPSEGHFYRARESILHCLAEQDAWLEAHLRPETGAEPTPTPTPPAAKL